MYTNQNNEIVLTKKEYADMMEESNSKNCSILILEILINELKYQLGKKNE